VAAAQDILVPGDRKAESLRWEFDGNDGGEGFSESELSGEREVDVLLVSDWG
jgi:hypothetical protein